MALDRNDYEVKSYVQASQIFLKWRIHRFAAWQVDKDEAIRSKQFSCSATKWKLEVYPRVNEDDNSYIGIFVRNIHLERDVRVRIKASLKDYQNNDHYARTAELNYRKNYCDSCSLAMCALSRKELLQKREQLLQNDLLTVYCEITLLGDIKLGTMKPRSEQPVGNGKTSFNCCDMLSKNFGALYKACNFCDATVKTVTQEFAVHKVVLAAHSPVFLHAFKESNVVEMIGIKDSVVEDFIRFMYTGKVDDLCLNKVVDLLLVAQKYTVEDLKSSCADYLSHIISLNNFVCLVNIADTLHNEGLQKAIKKFFENNFMKLVFGEDWATLCRTKPSIVADIKKDLQFIQDP